ncbi:MAG TPA: NADH-quinone oxidoreductase subunit NuoB [Polyangiaceae bacterium]|nr:NADH-quinone oxidoreductase subunit NuoB [Polyangiaceae bacterium]
MIRVLLARIKQGYRTAAYPAVEPTLPDRFRGAPSIDPTACDSQCSACVELCPTDALVPRPSGLALDMGRCLFCDECAKTCPKQAITFSREYRLAAQNREALWVSGEFQRAEQKLKSELLRLFGRSLKLRQVSAGGCNACEADINVLGTIGFDLGRFGIQIVASPRHADGIIVTGPVSQNMELALKKTYDAVAAPKIVIAVGACAISGGPYAGHPEVATSLDSILPVDLYVPGCPPHPYTILDGLLGMLGRLERTKRAG